MSMRGLIGRLTQTDIDLINKNVRIRFADHTKFRTPEALIIYEQRMLTPEEIFELCVAEYRDFRIEVPKYSYIPKELADFYVGKNVVPLRYDSLESTLHVGVVPELDPGHILAFKNSKIVKHYIPIHYYVERHNTLYAVPNFLLPSPATDIFGMIVSEAIQLRASDITFETLAVDARVYYNIRKRKVYSKRRITRQDVLEIARLICAKAGSPLDDINRDPKYVAIDLDFYNRGRVVVNNTYYGISITIRVLSNELMVTTMEELNLATNTIKFIRDHVLSSETGLRLICGPTMSGKNTTFLSALNELLEDDLYKTISVEYPVEILVKNMVQISVESSEEFQKAATSLLRQNPDIVYISEMTDFTALATLEIANTGKAVFSSVHSNSIAEVVGRLRDLTNLSIDRLISNIQTVIYQELRRDDENDRVLPYNTCLYFSDELKRELIGKTEGEVFLILAEREKRWGDVA